MEEPVKQTEIIDALCRDVVKNINKSVFEQKAKVDFLTEAYKDFYQRLEKEPTSSEDQSLLFEALCKAKADMKVDFEKTGNITNRGAYATYPDLVHYAKPFLVANGLDIIHEPIEKGDKDYLKTTITHASGQWRSSYCAIKPDYSKNTSPLQAYGGALTSMKRYVYAAILNLHTGD